MIKYLKLWPICLNLRYITAKFSGIRKFRNFTVAPLAERLVCSQAGRTPRRFSHKDAQLSHIIRAPTCFDIELTSSININHGVQHKMISVDNFFVFLRLIFFALLLLYVT